MTLDGSSRRLLGGMLTVAVGLAMTGLSTLVVMSLTARSLRPSEYAAFAVWWTVVTLLGTSFGVFETYLARLLVADAAAGRDPRGTIGVLLGRAASASALLTGALFAFSPLLADLLFAGSTALAVLLPVAVALSAAQALQRGAATGQQRFGAIAGQLMTDGVLRTLLTIALIASSSDSLLTLALATCVASSASLPLASRLIPVWLAMPRVRDASFPSRPLVYLLAAAVGPLLANNASLPWLAATGSQDPLVLGAFAGALTLARLPTQFVSAAFSPLLAHLTHAVEIGDRVTFRRLRRLALGTASALGLIFALGFAAIGDWLLGVYLGDRYSLAVWALAMLAAASGSLFVAYVEQASLAAQGAWPRITTAWLVATATFVVVLVLPVDELARASAAPLMATLAAVAMMAVGATRSRRLRARA